MNKKENTKISTYLYPTLFFRRFIFPLTTTIHADTREEQSAEKKLISLTERTSLFFEYLQQGKYAEALQLTSTAFQSKFTATTLQNWWTQSGWSGIKAWAPRDKRTKLGPSDGRNSSSYRRNYHTATP